MTRDKTFSATAVWKQFAENKDLMHKPKMFIFQACILTIYKKFNFKIILEFQACKGSNHSKPTDLLKKVFLVPQTSFTVDSILPDMVIVFSTIEGKDKWIVDYMEHGNTEVILCTLQKTKHKVCIRSRLLSKWMVRYCYIELHYTSQHKGTLHYTS